MATISNLIGECLDCMVFIRNDYVMILTILWFMVDNIKYTIWT